MRLLVYLFLICLLYNPVFSQKSIASTLKKYNSNTVEYISVSELKSAENLIVLDTREKEEFEVSKLKNAIWVGHKDFELSAVQSNFPDTNTPIVVYCSIGVRSEEIGEKLQKAGYTNIKNLYGGIFEWKNKGNTVYDSQNKNTDNVHAYSKLWGKLLTNAKKIY